MNNVKDATEEAMVLRLLCNLEPDRRNYKEIRATFTTDEGKFRGKRFNEIIYDDEAFETLWPILEPWGVNPNDVDIVVIEQHFDYIDEDDCDHEHWKVTADIIFAPKENG